MFFISNYVNINYQGFFMRLFLIFLIYSVLGWIIEVLSFIIEDHKLVNRGFLIGPYCPIHAVGAIASTICLNWLKFNPYLVFLFGIVLASFIEYFTSYLLEKLFHARWWDYSNAKFNINGRIKLSYIIFFGAAITFVIYYANPVIFNIVNNIEYTLMVKLFVVMFSVFMTDLFLSFKIISSIKIVSNGIKDNTEEISARVIQTVKNIIIFK